MINVNIICIVHSYVNSAVTMFTLATVDVDLRRACKKSINNTKNDILDRIYIPDWLAAGRNVALTFAMNLTFDMIR